MPFVTIKINTAIDITDNRHINETMIFFRIIYLSKKGCHTEINVTALNYVISKFRYYLLNEYDAKVVPFLEWVCDELLYLPPLGVTTLATAAAPVPASESPIPYDVYVPELL